MNVIVPCMSWVPICWRDLLGFFNKYNNGVNDPLLNHVDVEPVLDSTAGKLVKVNDPPSDLPIINNPLPKVDESLHNPLTEDVNPMHAHVVVQLPGKPYVDLPYLPNSIVEDILSWLPPKKIIQCQRDSLALHALTKTSYFAQIQLHRSNPVTVAQRYPASDSESGFIELYFIDEESQNIEKKTVDIGSSYKRQSNRISIVGSYDGFLLFTNLYSWEEAVYYLWNPITYEKTTWSLPYKRISYVCGFYFCSLRREYVLLFVSKKGERSYEFQIHNMRTKARENVGNCSYPPSRGRPPVIINRTLYWMVDLVLYNCIHGKWPCHSHLIVAFEMETGRFLTVGHNGRIGKSVYDNKSLHLFELERELCMCDPISSTELHLSVLNQKTKCWVKRHTVILPNCDFVRFNGYWMNKIVTEVIHYKKGELLVRQKNILYAYNLHSCTHRIVEVGFADHAFQATVHVDSLVSLGKTTV